MEVKQRKKPMSSLLRLVMILNIIIMILFTVTAKRNAESDYYEELKTLTKQYLMYATGENALQLNASYIRIDGNVYTGDNLDAYGGRVDIYGKVEITGHINKHQHTIFNSHQYIGGGERKLVGLSGILIDVLYEFRMIC